MSTAGRCTPSIRIRDAQRHREAHRCGRPPSRSAATVSTPCRNCSTVCDVACAAVAETGDPAHRALAAAADVERRPRLLQRHRRDGHVVQPVAAGLELGMLLRPQRAEQLERFLAAAHALLERHAEAPRTRPRASRSPRPRAAGRPEHVDAGQQLGHRDRRAVRQDHHAGAQRDARGDAGQPRQHGQRVEHVLAVDQVGVVRHHDVVGDPDRVEASYLRVSGHVEHALHFDRTAVVGAGQIHKFRPSCILPRRSGQRYDSPPARGYAQQHGAHLPEAPSDLRGRGARRRAPHAHRSARAGPRSVPAWTSTASSMFPEQPLTDDEHLAFAQALDGALHMRTGARVLSKSRFGNEALGDISNLGNDGEILQSGDRKRAYSLGNRLWHTDASFQDPPGRYSMLSAEGRPARRERTRSTPTCARPTTPCRPRPRPRSPISAPTTPSRIRDRCWASSSRRRKKRRSRARSIRWCGRCRAQCAKSLYVASHASRIIDWPIPEGRLLLRDLIEHATQRQFVYRHSWRVGDLVIWDNRCTMHRRPVRGHEVPPRAPASDDARHPEPALVTSPA